MTAWQLLAVTALLITLLLLEGWWDRYQLSTRRFMRQATKQLENLNVLIGTALIPAFQSAAVAFAEFGEAVAKAKALDPEGWEALDRELVDWEVSQ